MNNCIFCKIIAGEIPAAKIYEDEDFMAFLDINPIEKGHTLLIPKKHYQWMQDVPDEIISSIFVKAKKLMLNLKDKLDCYYVQIAVEGKDVPHFHIHLIPGCLEYKSATWNHTKYEENEMQIFIDKLKI
jgi:histidine triad (HIT) family protein